MQCKKKKVSNINFTWHEEVTQGCVCLNMCGLLFLADVLKSFFFLSFFWALPFNHVSFLLCEVFKKCFFAAQCDCGGGVGGALLYNLNGLTALNRTFLCGDVAEVIIKVQCKHLSPLVSCFCNI